jgi:hypothetical protein
VVNQLPDVAMNQGVRGKPRAVDRKRGRAQLESSRSPRWTNRRRRELLELLGRFDSNIDQLSPALEQEAEQTPEMR